ncbi:MAG: LamG domain-containing protein [Blastocatellia bacterium]
MRFLLLRIKRIALFALVFTTLLSGLALPSVSWMKSRASVLPSTATRPMLAAMPSPSASQTIIIYQNNFESPNVPIQANCATLDARGINFLYGTPQGTFNQVNTVEAVLLNSPSYSNPSGVGDNFAIGMLATNQNDLLALTFDSQGKSFINVAMDISGLDVPGCGGPFGVDAPTYRMRLINSPNSVFSFGFDLGAILAQQDTTGVAPPDQFTTNWSHQVVSLSTAGATDGKVTLVWDLLQSGYAIFDNLIITASDTPGDVGPSPPPPCSAAGQWSAEGNANDSSGNNHNGTLQNGATFAPGYAGQAFSLDGNDDYVEVPINSGAMNSPASFTMEAWINPRSLDYPVIFQKGVDVYNRAGLQITPDGSLCSYMNSGICAAISAPGLISTCAFTKVTLLYDGSTHQLVTYVNGSQVSSAVVTAPYNNTEPFTIGYSLTPVGYNSHFQGLIDEISFSSCVVPPATSQSIVTGCGPTSTPPPAITGGLPVDGGIMGPGSGFIPVAPGRFHTTLTGTGHPGCTIQVTVTDPARPVNDSTQTTTVDAAGNWSLGLDLYDCDPEIDIVQICDGVASDPLRRHIYVDGTPPVFISGGGPGDGTDFTGNGGTATIILDGGAADPGLAIHLPPGDGVTYEWHLFGPGGGDILLGSGGGSYWSFTGGGGILNINLPPGDYTIEEHVCDTAGNCFIHRCHRHICARLTVTGGLPGDEGIYGPGDGVTFGKVTRVVTGTGNPGCNVQVAVTDPAHPRLVDNNTSYTVPVDNAGNWSLPLTLDDCDPVVTITEICDGVSDGGDIIRQHVYVDGTPPTVGLGDGDIYVGTGGTGGIVLDAAAGDAGSHVPNDGLSYSWYIVPDGGAGVPVLLCGGCPGVYTANEPAGDYYFEVVVTDRAGNRTTKRCHRRCLKRPTAITYTGDVMIAEGGAAVLQGVLTDITPPLGTMPVPVVGRTVTLTLGSGPGAQSCTGVTDSTGFVRCTINPVNQPLGPNGIATDVFSGDDVYLPSNNGAQTLVFAFPGATGNFVIGDLNAQVGNHVTFWGAQWEQLNPMSGGPSNNSFKGFENQSSTSAPRCGETWTTDPGNSSGPPSTIPTYMGVIVSSSITKSGSRISGSIPKIVVVRTDAGYAPNPGHAGTGTVVAVFCQ